MELLLVDTVEGHFRFAKFSGVIHGADLDDYHLGHPRGLAELLHPPNRTRVGSINAPSFHNLL